MPPAAALIPGPLRTIEGRIKINLCSDVATPTIIKFPLHITPEGDAPWESVISSIVAALNASGLRESGHALHLLTTHGPIPIDHEDGDFDCFANLKNMFVDVSHFSPEFVVKLNEVQAFKHLTTGTLKTTTTSNLTASSVVQSSARRGMRPPL
ncbi:hypothetical protein BV22DRAFT_1194504 [Leucogyrophana mollusca]|uniref:Uncharacterized protein n=1 Tax=Leucogyrophana mollusca TaxID=85980 RepID=A0ACB8BL80_9AGAM|nr:hypothetical protein BV22DRAFT_1194504 [Leucogyrophana mollusca]